MSNLDGSDAKGTRRTPWIAATAGMFVLTLLWTVFLLSPPVSYRYRYDYGRPISATASPAPQDAQQGTFSVKVAAEIETIADKFTPEVLLSAPRRSSAVPNANGTLALYTVSSYSFESHKKTSEVRLFDITSRTSNLVINAKGVSEPHWLEDDILYLKSGANGTTELVVTSAEDVMHSYTAAVIQSAISNIKLKVLAKGKVAIVATGKASKDGFLYNPEKEPEKYSTGLLYDSLMVRHWDKYVAPQKNALFYGILSRSTQAASQYSLTGLKNALKDTGLESPIEPFPSSDHYDISSTGLVFVAKDPDLDPAFNTKCNAYYLPLSDFAAEPASKLQKIQVHGLDGAATSPVFSPDGKGMAFLQMAQNGYESDKNRIVHIVDLTKAEHAQELLRSADGKDAWDRSPSKVVWSNDGSSLYLLVAEEGRTCLFKVDVFSEASDEEEEEEEEKEKEKEKDEEEQVKKLTSTGTVSDVFPLSSSSKELFVSGSSFVDNSIWSILHPARPSSIETVSSNSRNGSSFSLSPSQVESIRFKGANDHEVHAWVIKPSTFQSDTKYPLAYLIHGGPQGAWEESWSTRWNPAVFAEQGYVVVLPNPTGSTSYGQAFTDAIHESWGGSPYEDLVAGMSYITTHLGYVDASRAVALGASYGGYMINWINGHPLGRQFRALVCHDGVFSMANQLSSDEQYFPTHDLGGRFWANASKWDRWDPARFVGAWRTPQLVVHSARDYRLPVSEGLAAFNALQARGVPSRFLTFPDENHWVIGEENSLVWHTVVLNWINGFVGLPPCGQEPEARNPRAKFVEGEGEDEAEGEEEDEGGWRRTRTKDEGVGVERGER